MDQSTRNYSIEILFIASFYLVISFFVPSADEPVSHRVHLRQTNVDSMIVSWVVVRVWRFVSLLLMRKVFLVLLVLSV